MKRLALTLAALAALLLMGALTFAYLAIWVSDPHDRLYNSACLTFILTALAGTSAWVLWTLETQR